MYDLVEWTAQQPWSNGNVGMIGISYFAGTQMEAAVERPPHLKAIMPLAGTFDRVSPFNTVFSSSRLHLPVLPRDGQHGHAQEKGQDGIRETSGPYRECPKKEVWECTGRVVGAVSIGSFERSRWAFAADAVGLWDFNPSVLG